MLRITSFSEAPTLEPTLWLRSFITALMTAFSALRESLAASRRYQRLRSSGASHDAAIRDALGAGLARPEPIHFAGRM